MDDAIQTAFSLKQFNAETGLSTDKLQRWQSVADEVNNSGKAVAESIKAIVSNQEKIKLGQGNISGYQLLGIDPRQNAFTILDQLRIKTKGLSQGMKKNILEQMGISKELIQVLELSKDKFDEMAKGAFIIPKGAIEIIDKARASSKQLGGAVSWLKGMIAANLAPSIIKLNKEIMRWIVQNKEGLIKTIKSIFDWVTRITTAIVRASRMFNEIINATIGWKNAIYILIGVIALLNSAFLLSPLGLFIAGIILLVGVLEDLSVYSQGGKSAFGEMLKKFPEMEKSFEGLKKVFDSIKDSMMLMKALFTGDETGIQKYLEKLGILGIGVIAVFDIIKMSIESVKISLMLLFTPIMGLIKLFDTFAKLKDKKITAKQALKETMDVLTFGDVRREAGKFLGEQSERISKQYQSVVKTFNSTVEINANTNASSDEIAKKATEEIKKQYDNVDMGSEDVKKK
jgi:hypothetical protein